MSNKKNYCNNCGVKLYKDIICPNCKFHNDLKDHEQINEVKNNTSSDSLEVINNAGEKNNIESGIRKKRLYQINRVEISITLSLLIIMFFMISYNVYSVSLFNSKIQQRVERHQLLESQQAEKKYIRNIILERTELKIIKESEIALAIITFDKMYNEIENKYLKEIELLNKKLDNYVMNISELIDLTQQMIGHLENFKIDFNNLYNIVPEQLQNYYDLKKLYIESNIELWKITLKYYSGEVEKDTVDIKHKDTLDLFNKTIEERDRAYNIYGLEILLK